MKKWVAAHREIVALVVLACVWAAAVVLWVSLGHGLADAIFTSVKWAIYAAVIWYIQARIARKTATKLAGQGGTLVYVRYAGARPGSLSGIWNMGVATFDEAGGLRFQPAVYATWSPQAGQPPSLPWRQYPPSPEELTGRSTNT